MAIILEGPDAAGKTTLGKFLRNSFNINLIASGGAPKSPSEVIAFCNDQLQACNDIRNVIDRVTPVSTPIYNPLYKNSKTLKDYLFSMINHPEVVFVYCRPPTDALMRPEKHQWKDYDTEEHKQKVLNNQMVYIELYDEAFDQIPHVCYDYTMREEDIMVELVAMIAAASVSRDAIRELKQLSRRGYVSQL